LSRLGVLSGFVLILFIPATIAVLEFNCGVGETVKYLLVYIVTPFALGLYYPEVFSFIKSVVVGLNNMFMYIINDKKGW
tara:strand:- start:19604 stop:19840 length:237 start_codon:yes stop_codon:yes gene_type:complete